ncbi:hypothetical protein ACSWVZ_003232 [Photobacterium damselae]
MDDELKAMYDFIDKIGLTKPCLNKKSPTWLLLNKQREARALIEIRNELKNAYLDPTDIALLY